MENGSLWRVIFRLSDQFARMGLPHDSRDQVTKKRKAEEKVVEAYRDLLEALGVREKFVEAIREAHRHDVSDGRICMLIEDGYSRSRIQQFRTGKYRKDL